MHLPLFSVTMEYVHASVRVPIHVGAWVHMCAFLWNLKAVFPIALYLHRGRLSRLNSEVTHVASLANQPALGISCVCFPSIAGELCHPPDV